MPEDSVKNHMDMCLLRRKNVCGMRIRVCRNGEYMKIIVKEILAAVNGTLLSGSEERCVASVSVDSRKIEAEALYVPVIGEKVNGHRFINGAFENGAVAAFVKASEKISDFVEGKAYIQVEDTIEALQALAGWYRDQFTMPVIGITGSVGKTTTKEMVSAALSVKYNVIKTLGNWNSQIGLPLMMFQFEPTHEVAVIEMGMSEEGEMERLSAIAKPDMGIMTNIGVAHIGQLGSQENIRKEKLNFINETLKNAPTGSRGRRKLFLNGDDSLLLEIGRNPEQAAMTEKTREALKQTDCVTFGLSENFDFYGKDVIVKDDKIHFTLVYPDGEEEIVLSVLGMHNVENALAALAAAYELGLKPSKAKKGLAEYQPIAMRGQVYHHNGVVIVDDTYNASPDSMKSSANVLLQMEKLDRRVIVLGDVLELGEVSYSCHYEVGAFIAKASCQGRTIDEVITVGCEAKAIADGVKAEGSGVIAVHSFATNEEALLYLREQMREKTGIIVKGSRGMHMETIVNGLLEQEFLTQAGK